MKIKNYLLSFFLLLFLFNCRRNEVVPQPETRQEQDPLKSLRESEKMTVLGRKMPNPYSVENMQKAYEEVSQNSMFRSNFQVQATDIYVRFLPKDSTEYYHLSKNLSLELFDRPLDVEVAEAGTYYHDPSIPEDQITWQYTTVPVGFSFPSVRYEKIEDCFIPRQGDTEEDPWEDGEEIDEPEAVGRMFSEKDFIAQLENKALINAGFVNASEQGNKPQERRRIRISFSRKIPEGTIRAYDNTLGRFEPIKGVKVRCNVGVKSSYAYTDHNGYYRMPHSFRIGPFYELIFENHKGFELWSNFAHIISARYYMGFHNKRGHSRDIGHNPVTQWAIINNATFDHYEMCDREGIKRPPHNLKIWASSLLGSSAPMLRRIYSGISFNSSSGWSNFFSNISVRPISAAVMLLFRNAMPDVTIDLKERRSVELYSTTRHELAHASHFSQVRSLLGSVYWERYIDFIITYGTYGKASDKNAGICGVGEMWGHAMGNLAILEKYQLTGIEDDNKYWFKPKIIYDLIYENILTKKQVYDCLERDVRSHEDLKNRMIEKYPSKKIQIIEKFRNHDF